MTDTHCHVHQPDYQLDAEQALERARARGVNKFVCVGTSVADSRDAVAFAAERDDCLASVAVHPHEAEGFGDEDKKALVELLESGQVTAVGECGLDYYYQHSPREAQREMLRWHLEQAERYELPVLFHIRDAFEEFWPIYDEFELPRGGVVDSFSAGVAELEQALERNLYVALNGIMTFTKDAHQLAAVDALPLEKLVLETDAPFLTPVPYRGTINEPQYVCEVAQFIADRRGVTYAELESITDANAQLLLAG